MSFPSSTAEVVISLVSLHGLMGASVFIGLSWMGVVILLHPESKKRSKGVLLPLANFLKPQGICVSTGRKSSSILSCRSCSQESGFDVHHEPHR